MATKEQIEKEADYYLENDDATFKTTATHFGISLRTLQLHMKKLEEMANEKYVLVKDKKELAQENGRRIGGSVGKRTITISLEQLKNISSKMIEHQLTYSEASQIYGIPTSTLWERNHGTTFARIDADNELGDGLDLVAEANRRNKLVETFSEETEDRQVRNHHAK